MKKRLLQLYYKLQLLALSIGLLACTPLARANARQDADFACVETAMAAYAAKPDPLFADLARFCIERSRHNTSTEAALRGQAGAGSGPVAVAGAPNVN
jgi:hypothetical protein